MGTLQDSMEMMLSEIVQVVPNLLYAVLILIVGWAVAGTIELAFKKFFKLIGFEKISSTIGLNDLREKAKIRMNVSTLLAKIIYYIVFLVFLTASLKQLGMGEINDMIQQLVGYIPNVIAAVIILLIGGFLAHLLSDIIKSAANAADLSYSKTLARVGYIIVMIFVFVIALDQVGIDTTLFTANITNIILGFIGATALAAGLGSKDLVGNFITTQTALKDTMEPGDHLSCGDTHGVIARVSGTGVFVSHEHGKTFVPAHKLERDGYTLRK